MVAVVYGSNSGTEANFFLLFSKEKKNVLKTIRAVVVNISDCKNIIQNKHHVYLFIFRISSIWHFMMSPDSEESFYSEYSIKVFKNLAVR